MGKWVLLASVVVVGCTSDATPQTGEAFFAKSAYPVLSQQCGGSTAGCHQVSSNDPFELPAKPGFVGLPADGAYDVLTYEGYTDGFAEQALLINPPPPHPGGALDPIAIEVVQQWFAIERHDRGYAN